MKSRTNMFWYALITALILGACCFSIQLPAYNETARIAMLDVGQGDSFLIQAANGTRMLIDAGPDEKVLSELSTILSPGDRRIDVVLATHPDADHIGGLSLVLSRYNIGIFLTTQSTTDSILFKTLMRTLDEKHIPSYFARGGMKLVFDEHTAFSILFPDRDTAGWETNRGSVVGKLEVGNASALFTGDSPSSIESFLAMAIPKELNVDILKLGHHGSKTSNSEVFLRATSPTLALISAGINNHYGHPSKEIIDRLQKLGIRYVSTQDTGTSVIESTGIEWFQIRN